MQLPLQNSSPHSSHTCFFLLFFCFFLVKKKNSSHTWRQKIILEFWIKDQRFFAKTLYLGDTHYSASSSIVCFLFDSRSWKNVKKRKKTTQPVVYGIGPRRTCLSVKKMIRQLHLRLNWAVLLFQSPLLLHFLLRFQILLKYKPSVADWQISVIVIWNQIIEVDRPYYLLALCYALLRGQDELLKSPQDKKNSLQIKKNPSKQYCLSP